MTATSSKLIVNRIASFRILLKTIVNSCSNTFAPAWPETTERPMASSKYHRMVFCLVIALWAMPAALFGMTADEIASKAGITGGLCSFPRATPEDVKLAIELAKRPTFVVHVMAEDDAQVAQYRAMAEAAGVLGRNFYVEKGSVASLPFADRLVDLLVIGNLSDADLTKQVQNECLRVIVPARGLAMVGNAGNTLTKAKLADWVKSLPPTSEAAQDASGSSISLRAKMPAGSDPWTHRLHGPESSQISMDTALQAPFLTQWWGLPRGDGYWGSTLVTCNGRMFYIRDNRLPSHSADYCLLTARNVNNGIVLWQKELRQRPNVTDGDFIPGRNCAIATMDSLFVIDRDGVVRLDAQTGAQRSRIAGPKENGQVKWMALQGNMLAVMSGEPDKILLPSFFKGMSKEESSLHSGDATMTALQRIVDNPMGRDVAVYDTETGQMFWRDTAVGDIDERLIVARDQRLYSVVPGAGFICREMKTGQILWTNKDPDVAAKFNTPSIMSGRIGQNSLPALTAYQDVLLMRSKGVDQIIALSRADGALLWKKAAPISYLGWYRGMPNCAVGDVMLGDAKPWNLKTGTDADGPTFMRSGCGITTSTPNYLITCFGRVTDVKTNKVIRTEDLKTACELGTIVSEGMMIDDASICSCPFELKGCRVLAPAGSIKPHTASPWKSRLTVLDSAEPAPLDVTAADWSAYRHDAQRSGASAAVVGDQPKKILWQWKPSGSAPYSAPYVFEGGFQPDYLSTAPVAAEDLVWFASHDGAIRCLNAKSGAQVWSFATGAMLFRPPTLWRGRLLAGGADGIVYCLNARTGKSLWHFQAAPLDRRVFWYGHLINTWPVLPGVVVQDNIAYAIAGYQKENGVYAYALDPVTGQVRWEKDDVGVIPDVQQGEKYRSSQYGPNMPFMNHSPNNKVAHWNKTEQEWTGLSSLGSVAVSNNKLWLPGGCLDLKTGERAGYGVQYGNEVGVLDQWVLRGGRRISETEDTLAEPYQSCHFTISTLSADEQSMTGISLNDIGTSLPAWDAQHILMPPPLKKGGSGLFLLPRAEFAKWMPNYAANYKTSSKGPDTEGKPTEGTWQTLKQWATEDIKEMQPAAFALAKDQAVVAFAYTPDRKHKNDPARKYILNGYVRETGKLAWSVDLPDQPAMNRLALDRSGHVLVSLCDGSVVCIGQ